MNCEAAQRRLTEDLTDRFDAEIIAHLKSCADCQRLCDDLVALEGLAKSLQCQHRVPKDFVSGVLARTSNRMPVSFFGLRPILLSVVVVMLSIGFYWMDEVASGREEFPATEEAYTGDMDWEGKKDPAYIEVLIKDPDEGEMILYLPSVIEIRRTELHEDLRYQNTAY